MCKAHSPVLAVVLTTFGVSCNKSDEIGPVVLVGVDGADWQVMKPLVAAGKLPNFAGLMARGAHGSLETIEPILSPIIWTTIATGRKPEEHGITWFMETDAKTGKKIPVSSHTREKPALWNMVSARGRKVGVVGWWASWPAEAVNGWVVSDRVADHGFGLRGDRVKAETGRTYPAELDAEIEPLVLRPDAITDAEVLSFMSVTSAELATRAGNRMNFANPLHHFIFALATNETYAQIAQKVVKELKPDLAMFYFEAVDSISHLFMKYMDPPMEGLSPELRAKFKEVVPRIYERQDAVLGKIIAAAGPNATFIIVSDHGFKTGAARLKEVDEAVISKAHLWHEKFGVIIMAGPAIVKDVKLSARVYDVAPTILRLMGLPTAKDMPGRVLTEAIRADWLSAVPATEVESYDRIPVGPPAAAAGVDETTGDNEMARLEALGYVQPAVTAGLLMNRAKIALDAGNVEIARKALSDLLAAEPENAEAQAVLARSEAIAGDFAKAEAMFQKLASSSDPRKARAAKIQHAVMLIGLGRSAEAERELRRLLEEKGNAEAYYHLGLALDRQGKTRQALTAYGTALSKQADYAPALNNAGQCSLKLGKIDEARAFFEKAAAADPERAEPRYNLALVLDTLGRREEALVALRAAAGVDPTDVMSRWELAKRASNDGRIDEARERLADVTKLDPKMARAWVLWARIEAALGNGDAARQFLETARGLDPDRADKALREDERLRQMLAMP